MLNPDIIRLALTVLAFVFLLGMVMRPFYGLLSYLIIMMVRPGSFYPQLGEIRIELIVGLLVIIVMFFSPGRLTRLLKLHSDPISKRMIILFGLMVISMLQAFDFETSWNWMNEFVKVFLFFLMIVTLVDTERDVKIFLWLFLLITGMVAYDAIYNYMHGIISHTWGETRIDYAVASGGMGSSHVALANMIVQAIPFLWYLGIANKKKMVSLVGIPIFVLYLYGVVISGSRGGFAGLIAFGICLLMFTKNRLLTACGVLAIIFILPTFSPTGYMDYMNTMSEIGADAGDTGSTRFKGLRNGFEMMIRRPILGVGPGCYPVARKAWFGWGLWAHNHYGELMGDLGLIGTWAWFAFLIAYMKKAVKLRGVISTTGSAILTGVIVSTIVRLVLGMGTHSVYSFIWYMMAAVVLALTRIQRETERLGPA